jgi:predicted transposase/invertase (TIGR01784 family)
MIDYAQKYEDQLADEMETATRKGIEQGIEQGIEKGVLRGEKKANAENARRMKGDGMSSELISKYTRLSVEEIKGL